MKKDKKKIIQRKRGEKMLKDFPFNIFLNNFI